MKNTNRRRQENIMIEKTKPSKFASLLRRLLDESGVYSRSEWAEFLRVSEPAISQWLHDRTLPTPEHLRKIVWVIKNTDDVPVELIKEFEQLAKRPAVEITPRFDSIGTTLGEYLLTPLIEVFLQDLRRLETDEQEKVLLMASRLCTEQSGRISVFPEYSTNEVMIASN